MQGRVEGSKYIRDYLNASTAEFHSNFKFDERPRPMIFLNACQLGRASYKLTGTGGFARAFLRSGASAFVGALWSVGDHPAMTFTKEFYDRLTESRPVSVAEATKFARIAAQKSAMPPGWPTSSTHTPHAQLG